MRRLTRLPELTLRDLPNIGPATERDLALLGIHAPRDLAGKDPEALYDALCVKTGTRQDPCVRDVFAAIVHHVDGGPARPWWYESRLRKAREAKGRKV